LIGRCGELLQTHKTGIGGATFCEAELRLRSQLRVPFWPQAGDFCVHEQDPGKNELRSTFPHPFLAAPWAFALDLLWITARRRREKSIATSSPL
jgi:hypothetical protein